MTEQKQLFISELNGMLVDATFFTRSSIEFIKTMLALPESIPSAPPFTVLLLRKLELDVPMQRRLKKHESKHIPGYHLLLRVCNEASKMVSSSHCVTHLRKAYKSKPHNAVLVDTFLMKCMEVLRDEIWYLEHGRPSKKAHVIQEANQYHWLSKGNSTVVGKSKQEAICYY